MQCVYSAQTGAAVALAAATAKSVLGLKASANAGVQVKKYRLALDGITFSNVPGLVELCQASFVTNSPGTNSTSVTPVQTSGRTIATGATAARNWSAEPTVLTVIEEHLITPAGGLEIYDFPLGDEPDCDVSTGFVLRLTFPAIVNARATFWYSRI